MLNQIQKLINFISEQKGLIAISCFEEDFWLVSVEFGREDEDSPIVAGASYAQESTLVEALNKVVEEIDL